jgi:hypothetical protein
MRETRITNSPVGAGYYVYSSDSENFYGVIEYDQIIKKWQFNHSNVLLFTEKTLQEIVNFMSTLEERSKHEQDV